MSFTLISSDTLSTASDHYIPHHTSHETTLYLSPFYQPFSRANPG